MKQFALAFAFVFLLGAAGCGGPSKEEKYANAVNKAQTQWGQKIADLASPEPTSSIFDQQDKALESLISDLRGIKDVPGKAQAAHAALIAALTSADKAIDNHSSLSIALRQVSVAIQNINRSI